MKKIVFTLFVLLMFAGCHQGSMSEKLNEIDSLIVKEQYDSASVTIEELKKKIKEKLEELSPEMIRGQMLFEQIKKGEINSIHEWSRDDEKLFVDYYNVMEYGTVNRLTSVKRAGKLTTHNLFYLLLKEMGKTDSEIQELLSISHNALKVIKSKTKEIE